MDANIIEQTTVSRLAAELNDINKENSELIKFIEELEAYTTDKNTASSIQIFMRNKGYWPKQ